MSQAYNQPQSLLRWEVIDTFLPGSIRVSQSPDYFIRLQIRELLSAGRSVGGEGNWFTYSDWRDIPVESIVPALQQPTNVPA